MVTFKDLITGDISDSPSDRLAAPFLLFLSFPVVVPCSVVYYSAKGIIKLGEIIHDNNPIRFNQERKLIKKQIEEGKNPFSENDNRLNDYVRAFTYTLSKEEREDIVEKTEKSFNEFKNNYQSYNANSVKLNEEKTELTLVNDYKPKRLTLKMSNINKKQM